MNRLLHASVLAVFIAAASGAPVHAAGQAETTDARFTALDRDNNDMLSPGEYAAEARARFDAMDLDHNRNVTVAELDAADAQSEGEMSSAQKIALNDQNKDGILSIDEHQAAIEAQFKVIDANADDSIDLSELKSDVPVRVPQP
jgi:hypothetical protein